MRGALSLLVPCFVFALGCGSDGACVLDSDCADFMMVCIDRQCVPTGSVDGGRRDAGSIGGDDAGTAPEDAGSVADASVDASTPDGATPSCADVTGTWTVTPSDAAACAGGMEMFSLDVAAGTTACLFTTADPLPGTFTVGADGALSGTFTVAGTEVACTGTVTEAIVLSCDACQFTLAR